MLQQAITNNLETKGRVESLSKERENIKKNQVEILELKNTLTKTKRSWDGFSIRMKMTEERISELEDKSIETSQSEQKEKQTGKKN